MRIGDVMASRVISVRPEELVRVAIARMLEENIGAVVVCEADGALVGIFTERDVLRLAGEGSQFGEARVVDVMTPRPVTLSPDDSIVSAARLMGERKIRHVPIVQDGHTLGLAGIREVLSSLVEAVWRSHDEQAHESARGLLGR